MLLYLTFLLIEQALPIHEISCRSFILNPIPIFKFWLYIMWMRRIVNVFLYFKRRLV